MAAMSLFIHSICNLHLPFVEGNYPSTKLYRYRDRDTDRDKYRYRYR